MDAEYDADDRQGHIDVAHVDRGHHHHGDHAGVGHRDRGQPEEGAALGPDDAEGVLEARSWGGRLAASDRADPGGEQRVGVQAHEHQRRR